MAKSINDVNEIPEGALDITLTRLKGAIWHLKAAKDQLGKTHGAFALFDDVDIILMQAGSYLKAVKDKFK